MRMNRLVLVLLLLTGSMVASAGCSARTARTGDTVTVEYTGKLTDGTVFDSSVGRDPIEFKVGSGQMISGFDRAVLGMKVGESKTVTIPASEAYGPHSDALVTVVRDADLAPEIRRVVGQRVQGTSPGGGMMAFTITAVADGTVTLDANHPLAGKDLVFQIRLLSVK